MLNKVVVKNFECHKLSEVPIGQFTAIVGSSFSGKSALIRALRAAVGLAVEASHYSVVLEFDDFVMVREKSSTVNGYSITVDGKEASFTKVGTSVPQLVQDHLRFQTVVLANDKVDLNMRMQFDSMLTLSGPVFLVRYLFKMSGVGALLDGLVNVNKSISSLSSEIAVREPQLASATDKCARLASFINVLPDLSDSSLFLDFCSSSNELLLLSSKLLSYKKILLLSVQEPVLDGSFMEVLSLCDIFVDAVTLLRSMKIDSIPEHDFRLVDLFLSIDKGVFDELSLLDGDLVYVDKELVSANSSIKSFELENKLCPWCGSKF